MRSLLPAAVLLLALACGQYPQAVLPDGVGLGGSGGDPGTGGDGGDAPGCDGLGDTSRATPNDACFAELELPPNPCELPAGVDHASRPVRGVTLSDGEACWSIVLSSGSCGRVAVVRLSNDEQVPVLFAAGLPTTEIPCELVNGVRVCRMFWADGDLVGVSARCACEPQGFEGVFEDPRALITDAVTVQYCFPQPD